MPPESKIETWIGSPKNEVIAKIGKPTYDFEYENAEYVIYETTRKETFAGLFPVPLIPGAVPAVFTEEHPYLLMLIFDQFGKLEQSTAGLPRDERTRNAIKAELMDRAKSGDVNSLKTLALIPLDLSTNEREAIKAELIERARSGDVTSGEALVELFKSQARRSGGRDSVAQAAQFRQRAWEGDLAAATALARCFGEREALEMLANANPEAAQTLLALDEQPPHQDLRNGEDAEEQYQRYLGNRTADTAKALKSLCWAADQGHLNARLDLGWLYEHGKEGLPKEPAKAYLWYNLAAAVARVSIVEEPLQALVPKMSSAELTRGEQLLRTWKPGQCERAILK